MDDKAYWLGMAACGFLALSGILHLVVLIWGR